MRSDKLPSRDILREGNFYMRISFYLRAIRAECSRGISAARALFQEHAWFGPAFFLVITTVLMLPAYQGVATDAVKYGFFALGLCLLGLSVRPGAVYSMHRGMILWAGAWVLAVTVSTVLSRDAVYAVVGNYPRYNSSWIVYAGFALLVYAVCVLGQRYTRAWVYTLSICAACVAVFGLLQAAGIGYYGGFASLFAVIPDRVPSLLGNPNFSSWFVAACLPFGLVGVLQSPRAAQRVAWILFLAVSLWSLAVFASRGSLLAAAVGGGAVLAYAFLSRQWLLVRTVCVAGACAVLLCAAYFTIYRAPLSGTTSSSLVVDSSAADRFVAWDIARVAWQSSPLFGIGPGNFDQYYWEQLPSSLMGGFQYFDDAHNVLLMLLADLGVVGFLLLALLVAVLGARVLKQAQQRQEFSTGAAATIGIGIWIVAGLFNPAVIPLWVLLGVLIGIAVLSHQAPLQRVTVRRSVAIGVWVLSVLVLLIGVGVIGGEHGLIYAIRHEQYRMQTSEVLAKQQKATRWAALLAPYNPEMQYGALLTRLYAGESALVVRGKVKHVAMRHPYSARVLLLAAQVSAESWQLQHDPADKARADEYLEQALLRSRGYPPTYSWAAYYYWLTGNSARSEQYVRIAVESHPTYFYNWILLAKQYREKGNLHGMRFALSRAQQLVPDDSELARLTRKLAQTQDPHAVDIVPGAPPVLVRLR